MSTWTVTPVYTRDNPLCEAFDYGRNMLVPMVTNACDCGVVHNMSDQTLWYATRVRGNSENGYEPWCKAHDEVITLTLRVRDLPDVVSTHPTMDEAVRVLKGCTELPGNEITGWSLNS